MPCRCPRDRAGTRCSRRSRTAACAACSIPATERRPRADCSVSELVVGPTGDLWGLADGARHRHRDLVRPGRLTVSDSGTIYLLLRPDGQINHTNVAGCVPVAGACTTPDIRPTVHIAGADSGVANRFVEDGCTLNDLAPQRGSLTKREFIDRVAAWANRLKDEGVVSNPEAQTLRLTAIRSV